MADPAFPKRKSQNNKWGSRRVKASWLATAGINNLQSGSFENIFRFCSRSSLLYYKKSSYCNKVFFKDCKTNKQNEQGINNCSTKQEIGRRPFLFLTACFVLVATSFLYPWQSRKYKLPHSK